jgi:hypothetical protein
VGFPALGAASPDAPCKSLIHPYSNQVQNPPVELADAFYEYLDETTILDHDGWAYDLTHRVAQRLQAGDPAECRLEPVVTWIERATAFTVPGRYVYFSRALLQCGLSEEAVAFVFAHELAHHRLGHLKQWLKEVPGAWILGLLVRAAHSVVASPEKEAAADRWALERCVDVGYDRERCLEIFKALEKISLDAGAVDVVFGPEDPEALAGQRLRDPTGAETTKLDGMLTEARRWLWQRRVGYPSVRERRAALAQVGWARPGSDARSGAPLIEQWRAFVASKGARR